MYYWNGFRRVFKNLDLFILELVHKKKGNCDRDGIWISDLS